MLVWMVGSAGDDVAAGFRRAAELYQSRAAYRADLLLYGALPTSVVFLGMVIVWQGIGLFLPLIRVIGMMSQ